MFDLSRMVLLQRARTAFGAGRLDEAFGIITSAKVREHRQAQILLEKIVVPLLKRATEHFEAKRHEEALADVERAAEAGGKKSHVIELRERILAALRDDRKVVSDEQATADSVQRRLRDGQLLAAEERLNDLPEDKTDRVRLGREVKDHQRERDALCARLRDHMDHGELTSALKLAAQLTSSASPEDGVRDFVLAVVRDASSALETELTAGKLQRATELAAELQPLIASGYGEATWTDAFTLCHEAARVLSTGDWSSMRVVVGQLAGVLPGSAWVGECQSALRTIDDAVHKLKCGPLGKLSSGGELPADTDTLSLRPLEPALIEQAAATKRVVRARKGTDGLNRREVLWVDGVGSFLLLPHDRVTIGRAGSTARPDVALSADLQGIHAEFVRVDGDYFVVARDAVEVNGRFVEKHLLVDGDEIRLGRRCRVKFRQPSSLSATAVLDLGTGMRLPGDIRQVVLLDRHMILGAQGHVRVCGPGGGKARHVVLLRDGDGFIAKASEPLVVDGDVSTGNERIPLGVRVETGGVTFTLTKEQGSEEGGVA